MPSVAAEAAALPKVMGFPPSLLPDDDAQAALGDLGPGVRKRCIRCRGAGQGLHRAASLAGVRVNAHNPSADSR